MYNYGVDRLGSTTALTSTSGSLVNTYRYDPWGQSNGGTGTAYNPFRYTGTYLDTMTGTYQMGARYYQPGTGRFTQQDPLPKSVMTTNRYAYAGSNPTNFVDPTGLDHVTPGCYGDSGTEFTWWGATIQYLDSCQVEQLLDYSDYGLFGVGYVCGRMGLGACTAVAAAFEVGSWYLEWVHEQGGEHGLKFIQLPGGGWITIWPQYG